MSEAQSAPALPPVVRWLAEAIESGNPLAPLPAELAPATVAQGQEIAALVLEELGLVACGLRLGPGPQGREVPGPLLEARLLRDGAVLALGALPHARARPGIAGLLAAPLEPGASPPRFASLHPALDISASRFAQGAADDACHAADLGGLGLVLLGAARRPPEGMVPVALRRNRGRRVRAVPMDAMAALGRAAGAAREAGGLPAGALLLALLGPGKAPQAGEELIADLGQLGRVRGLIR